MVQNILIEISSFFQWMRFFFLHLFFIFIKDTCQERFSILKKEDNILLYRLFSSNTISAIFQMLQFHSTINIIFCVEGEMMIFFLYLKLKTTCNDFQRKNSTQTRISLISKTYCTQTFLVQFYKCASCKCNILHGQIHYSKLQSFVVERNQLNSLLLSRMTFINIYFQMKSFDKNFVCVLLAFFYF